MTWVLFDYGGVICQPQLEAEVALLAQAAGGTVQAFSDGYWAYRLDYDRAKLDAVTYWQKVGAGLGRSYSAAEIAELTRLDVTSWRHLKPGTVTLIEDLAAAGHRLALLSNPELRDLPMAKRICPGHSAAEGRSFWLQV